MRLLHDQIDWFTFRTHELVNPGELCGPLRVGREVPGHRSSFRYSVVLTLRPAALWRTTSASASSATRTPCKGPFHDDHDCRRAAASSVAWLSTWLRFSSSRADSNPPASMLTCTARLVNCTPSGVSSAM